MRLANLACAAASLSVCLIQLAPSVAWARPEPDTVADERSAPSAVPVEPHFVLGFAALKDQLGDLMGEPIELEHPPPDGGADAIQLTSTGLAAYTEGKLPAFTDGWQTWQLIVPASPSAAAVSGGAAPGSPPRAAPAFSVWDTLARCESQGNWSISTGNGFFGGLQFDLQTWRAYGGAGMPNRASRAEQIAVAERLRAARGFQPWPACSRALGLR